MRMEAQTIKDDRGTLGVPEGQIPPTGAASAPNKGDAPADMTIASITGRYRIQPALERGLKTISPDSPRHTVIRRPPGKHRRRLCAAERVHAYLDGESPPVVPPVQLYRLLTTRRASRKPTVG